jgi:hypothetical protein
MAKRAAIVGTAPARSSLATGGHFAQKTGMKFTITYCTQ